MHTNKQREETGRHTGRQKDGWKDRKMEGHIGRWMNRQTDRQTDSQFDLKCIKQKCLEKITDFCQPNQQLMVQGGEDSQGELNL